MCQVVGRVSQDAVADLAVICAIELASNRLGTRDQLTRASEGVKTQVFGPSLKRRSLHNRLRRCLRPLALFLERLLLSKTCPGTLFEHRLVPLATEVGRLRQRTTASKRRLLRAGGHRAAALLFT
eukprot:scaffold294400_cov30-Tisochrysis_lutea.AAC.2